MRLSIKLALIILTFQMAGCQIAPEKPLANVVECPEVRAKICTFIYQPVCAYPSPQLDCTSSNCDNSPPTETHSNACLACSHTDIFGYTTGACEKQ